MRASLSSWRDRIVVSGEDRSEWLRERAPFIGASDMKMYAKAGSVEKYVAAKIRPKSFFGNETTESGHRWEPMILAYLGVPENKAFVRSPTHERIACTPDGISEDEPFTLAECKTRHGLIKPNPDAGEWRQLAAQLFCFPEAERVLFGTLTVLRNDAGQWEARDGGYTRLEVPRDHPKIIAATELIIPIAERVIEALDVAKQAMKEVTF